MMKFTEKIKNLAYLTPLYDWLGKRSFAQSGEDVIAWGELGMDCRAPLAMTKRKGFYVDVGAYHPKLFSNTYLFYKKGWRGICVEPNPEMRPLYRLVRPRDVFLNYGVGGGLRGVSSQDYPQGFRFAQPTRRPLRGKDRVGNLEYFMFEDGAANTFSAKQARKNIVEAGRKLKGKTKIKIKTLKSILDKNLPKGQKIDLLSVDVEGMDEEVLRSNDWKKYRPRLIIAEDLGFELESLAPTEDKTPQPRRAAGQLPLTGEPRMNCVLFPPLSRGGLRKGLGGKWEVGVVGFLKGVGYSLVAKTPYSLIFRAEPLSP